MDKWNKKCRFFDEKFACDTLTTENYTSCNECKFSQEYSKKILIIKLGAMGDVLRTTVILPSIKKKYGEDVFICWMTNPESKDFLKNNHLIDKVLICNTENILRIQQEKFDILFALEIDTPSTLLANLVKAEKKFGYYFDNGATSCFNKSAEDYLETAFLNHIKVKNRKTYQELICEACELREFYDKEKPMFDLKQKHRDLGKKFILENNLYNENRIIGINIGSASRWPSKFWDTGKIKELARKLSKYSLVILAGPNEINKQKELIEEMKKEGLNMIGNNPGNTLDEFAAIVNICNTIICGDTMVLHLATSLNKKTVSLFFATSPWEVEGYGTMKKLISPLLEKYFYINRYIDELAESISIDDVVKVTEEQINL